jgi:cephalosporin hydroxylase
MGSAANLFRYDRKGDMQVYIDTTTNVIEVNGTRMALYSNHAFELLSDIWVKVGWNQKYVYTFSWLGVPIIQLPEDLMRYQEVIYCLRPDIIIETGIAHGASAVFAASLLKLIGNGRLIAVDIEIRPSCRRSIEAHELNSTITLIEGSSVAENVVENVKAQIGRGEKVLVLLDSCHSYAHVMAELEAYAPLVTPGSYIVACDGIMRELNDTPRGVGEWVSNNPARAAVDFAARNPAFVIDPPSWLFNESSLNQNVTHWPNAWLKRVE